MTNPGAEPRKIEIQTNVPVERVVDVTGQELLMITRSNAAEILHTNWERVRSRHDWATPLGILIAILTALLTTDFVKLFNVGADVWTGVFWSAAALCLVWLYRTARKRRRLGPALTPDGVIKLLMTAGKSSAQAPEATPNHTPSEPESPDTEPVSTDPPGTRYPEGTRVWHDGYGDGMVIGRKQVGRDSFVQVRFAKFAVTKSLNEDLAPLRKIDHSPQSTS